MRAPYQYLNRLIKSRLTESTSTQHLPEMEKPDYLFYIEHEKRENHLDNAIQLALTACLFHGTAALIRSSTLIVENAVKDKQNSPTHQDGIFAYILLKAAKDIFEQDAANNAEAIRDIPALASNPSKFWDRQFHAIATLTLLDDTMCKDAESKYQAFKQVSSASLKK